MSEDFNLQYIEDAAISVASIPGINALQLDYVSSIGGANAPEPGADKTAENIALAIMNQGSLATKNSVTATEIANGAITTVKIALGAVTADIVAAGAITENKLYTGAVTADKIAANTITAAKIAANTITANEIAAYTITAAKMNVAQLSAIAADLGSITAGTITGALLQTSSSSYTGVKISSSIGGINMYGQSLSLYDTGGTLYGYIGGYGGYYNIATYNNRNMLLGAGSGTLHLNSTMAPLNNAAVNLGYYNYAFGNVYSLNYSFNNSQYLHIYNSDTSALECVNFSKIRLSGYSFRRVGFTFKDGSSVNRYIEVLAVNDPV